MSSHGSESWHVKSPVASKSGSLPYSRPAASLPSTVVRSFRLGPRTFVFSLPEAPPRTLISDKSKDREGHWQGQENTGRRGSLHVRRLQGLERPHLQLQLDQTRSPGPQ